MAEEAGAEAPKAKGSNKLIIILIAVVVVLLLAIGGGAAWFFLSKDEAPAATSAETANAEAVKSEAIYVKIRTQGGKPYFIANFSGERGTQRFLQIYVEARTRDEDVKAAIDKHMPLIVSELQTLFSTQTLRSMQTAEGRERLQVLSTERIQNILQEEIGKPGIESVFFTNFVMQ